MNRVQPEDRREAQMMALRGLRKRPILSHYNTCYGCDHGWKRAGLYGSSHSCLRFWILSRTAGWNLCFR